MNTQTPDIETPKPEDDRDWLLQHLIEVTNSGIPVPVTLTTAAGLVTGVTITGPDFLDLFKLELTRQWPAHMQDTYSEVVEQWKADIYSKSPDNEADSPAPTFIHLKDARLFNAGTVVPGSGGMLWRGKLSSIIGFTIGVLKPDGTAESDAEE